jgi:hypothetical protein
MKNDTGGEAAGLLEPQHITVTDLGENEYGDHYEVASHRCRCWFCQECCRSMGKRLRDKLLPILETFRGLMMWTFTVDPELFRDPVQAYRYMRERRCIARTLQDIWRAGYLHSQRYFYVVEWQRDTEQAHFHVLLDASYIPWHFVLESWSKHRPAEAGPVRDDRPAFGTVIFSKGKGGRKGPFASAYHAACYATKYLTKTPEHGFPAWVLALGENTRIRRYSASRGFWGEPTERSEHDGRYEPKAQSYRKRVGNCGTSVDVFEVRLGKCDMSTGELPTVRAWVGELDVAARDVLAAVPARDARQRHRRSLTANTVQEVRDLVAAAVGSPVTWRRGGPVEVSAAVAGPDAPDYGDWRAEVVHEQYQRNFDAMIRRFMENQS